MTKADANKAGGIGLPTGTKIGKYEVRQRLGIGGQAIVYKCYDPLLDRYVAVKQISTHLAEYPKFLERFRKEAQILAKLGSEQSAIVTIHELVEDERGLFIVMEFFEGHTLETILAESAGAIEDKATLQIIWRLAAALHAVHSAGIIHRDIKPANILIGEGLRPKITDFGVAATKSGQTSMLLGTTKYMAPELFEGVDIDGRADMYSLGFVAYEMLAGRPKFNEVFADLVRDRHSEALRWMKWHGNKKVVAPPLHEINPAVPVALSDIVARMMAKDRDDRFEDMEAMGRAIKAGFSPRARASRQPISSHPTSRTVSKLAEKSDLALTDEADELEVAPEPPPTAELPKKHFSLRTKLALLGVIAASVMAIGVIIGIQQLRHSRRLSMTATSAYTAALAYYDRAEPEKALAGFVEVQRKFPGTRQARMASVQAHLSRAHIAVKGRNWREALIEEEAAAEQVEAIQSKNHQLLEWTRERKQEISAFKKYRIDTRIFVEALGDAQLALEAGKFDESAGVLDRELRGISLTESQDTRLRSFRERIATEKLRAVCADYINQGQELVRLGDFDAAQQAYQQAWSVLNSESADILGDAERKALQEDLLAKRSAMAAQRDYLKALAAAEEARSADDGPSELAALQAAAALKPSAELTGQIAQLQSAIALRRGRKFKASGEIERAYKAFEESLKYKFNEAARKELEGLAQAALLKSLIDAGDTEMVVGNFSKALGKYKEASRIEMDAALAGKITECQYRIELARADKLRDVKNYDQAERAYEKARSVSPAKGAEIDARLGSMDRLRRYEGLLAAGDKALQQQHWDKALEAFRKARDIRDTKAVNDRIELTQYSKFVARGKEAMDREDYKSAWAYFNRAKEVRDTVEINALIAEAEQRMKEKEQE